MMEQTFILEGYEIRVQLEAHTLHITNDRPLQQLIAADMIPHTALLVRHMCDAYQQSFGSPLEIAPDSIAVEIWGHIYFGRLGTILENLTQLKLIEKIADVIVSACAVIDCGEKGHDHNRWFWDLLAPFKERIAEWLSDEKSPQSKDS